MHDYFDIFGVPPSARAVEVRRLCAAHVRRWHPDFRPITPASSAATPLRRDVAVDFVAMTTCTDRIHRQFFGSTAILPT